MEVEVGPAKVSIPLRVDLVDLQQLVVPEPQPQPDVTIRFVAGGVRLTATFAGKRFRKLMKGVDPTSFLVVQGRLVAGGVISEAGIQVQPYDPLTAKGTAVRQAAIAAARGAAGAEHAAA